MGQDFGVFGVVIWGFLGGDFELNFGDFGSGLWAFGGCDFGVLGPLILGQTPRILGFWGR